MKLKIIMKNLLVLIIIAVSNIIFAQNYSRGLVLDQKSYQKIPVKANILLKGDLPSTYSLKKFTPNVKSQGQYGTCVGWSTGWSLRTTLEAINKNWTDKNKITENGFSPIFTYYNSKDIHDDDCKNGTNITSALNVMKEKGIPYYKDFSPMCTESIPQYIYDLAKRHKIKDYTRLLSANMDAKTKISNIKNAIYNNHPIVIGIACPNSFDIAKGVWVPTESISDIEGAHAITLIGYDDNKYGGAFEIMNSWGTNWGNEGYMWIKYKDFLNYCFQAVEVYLDNKEYYKTIAGSIKFKTDKSINLNVNKVKGINAKGLVVVDNVDIADYAITEPLYSMSRYRMLITVKKPVYLYAIASDLDNNTSIIFPHTDKISPYINYDDTEIPIPNNKYWIQLDDNVGVDYLIVLFSLKELDIKSIKNDIKIFSGNINEKIENALGDIIIDESNCNFNSERIKFLAKSKDDKVVAIVIKMDHK